MIDFPLHDKKINLAFNQAVIAHANQYRNDNKTPYITHPIRVANRVYRKYRDYGESMPRLVSVALLHDSIEDSNGIVTKESLFHAGVDCQIIDNVAALTKSKEIDYFKYLFEIGKSYPIATLIKIEDILDNLSDSPSLKQMKKYGYALQLLSDHAKYAIDSGSLV